MDGLWADLIKFVRLWPCGEYKTSMCGAESRGAIFVVTMLMFWETEVLILGFTWDQANAARVCSKSLGIGLWDCSEGG